MHSDELAGGRLDKDGDACSVLCVTYTRTQSSSSGQSEPPAGAASVSRTEQMSS